MSLVRSFKLVFNETAVITESKQILKLGKFRLYNVTFRKKHARIITDMDIKPTYRNMGRITNNLFIALMDKELQE